MTTRCGLASRFTRQPRNPAFILRAPNASVFLRAKFDHPRRVEQPVSCSEEIGNLGTARRPIPATDSTDSRFLPSGPCVLHDHAGGGIGGLVAT